MLDHHRCGDGGGEVNNSEKCKKEKAAGALATKCAAKVFVHVNFLEGPYELPSPFIKTE